MIAIRGDGGRPRPATLWTSVSKPVFQISSPFRRIHHYLRIQVGRLLAFFLLGRKSEFFAPGQMQALFYLSIASPIPFFVVGAIIFGLNSIWIIPYSAVTYKNHSTYSVNHVILWMFSVFLLPAAAFLYRLRNSTSWIEFRDSSRIFKIFGSSQHLVPNVCHRSAV